MKKTLSYLGLAVLILASCAKETNEPVQSPVDEGFSIKAYVVDGDVTKTTYAGETTFSWDGEEIISMQLIKKSDSTRDRWLFYNNSDAGTTANYKSSGSLPSDTWGLGEYAFYPAKANSYCPDETWNIGNYQAVNLGTAEVRANSVVVSDYVKASVSSPMQYIPLIGVKDGDGNFGFHTATGILKVTVSNIDARLAKVQLYSEGQKLNGTYTLTGSGTGAYIAMTTTSTASEQVFNAEYTDWTSQTSLPFYFPVPVGTLNSGFKVRLLDSDSNVLRQVSAPSNVLIERNKISEITTAIPLPDEDFSATITPGGTSAELQATIDLGKDATSAKVVLASSVSAGQALIDSDDASIVSFADGETKALPMTNITASGKAYIVAKTYKDATEKLSASAEAYVLTSEDATDILSQYMRVLTNVGAWTSYYYSTSYSTDYEIRGDNTLTLEASNNPSTSNVMLTEFAGYYYDPSLNTHTTMRTTWDGFSAGNPLYAVYSPNTSYGSSTGFAEFKNASTAAFYTDSGSHPHYICEVGSTTLRIATHSTGYSSPLTSNDLVVWGAKVGNCFDSTDETNTDVCLGRYVGKKTKGMIDLTGKISVSSTGTNNSYVGDNLGAAALIDKTDDHWHSDYIDTPSLDATYGIYAQIDLGESKTIQNFTVNFKTRSSANQLPREYIIGGTNDPSGEWTVITTKTSISTEAGKWYQVYATSGTAYRYIRIGFTKSAAGDLTTDPSTSKIVAIAELQLWEN